MDVGINVKANTLTTVVVNSQKKGVKKYKIEQTQKPKYVFKFSAI